ncbi:MAG TPA: hypothetical protein ENK84_10975 [Desulfobulbus sp.]|nr:hypothetical protein [Desulfobulbus sp.]
MTILFPVIGVILAPGTLTLFFVYFVIGIHLQLVPLPFILSCLLARFGAAITLVPGSWITRLNLSAAGTAKGELFHNYLSVFLFQLPEK